MPWEATDQDTLEYLHEFYGSGHDPAGLLLADFLTALVWVHYGDRMTIQHWDDRVHVYRNEEPCPVVTHSPATVERAFALGYTVEDDEWGVLLTEPGARFVNRYRAMHGWSLLEATAPATGTAASVGGVR